MFWVISVYFNIKNTLPKSGIFLLGHPVYDDDDDDDVSLRLHVSAADRHLQAVAPSFKN